MNEQLLADLHTLAMAVFDIMVNGGNSYLEEEVAEVVARTELGEEYK